MEWLGYAVTGVAVGGVVIVMLRIRQPSRPVAVALVSTLIAAMVLLAWTSGDVFGFVWATFLLGWLVIRLWARRRAPAGPSADVSRKRPD